MAITPINLGTAGNDGTGDPIRTAFSKVNLNDGLITGLPGTNPATGTVALTYDTASAHRILRYNVTANTTFTFTPTGKVGMYYVLFGFQTNVLRTIGLPASWTPEAGSEQIDSGLKNYLLTITVHTDAKVTYFIKGTTIVDESQFVNPPTVMIGDHGEVTDPGHDAVGNYINGLSPGALLLVGDVNYPSGSASTINGAVAIFDALIAAQKVWPAFGNHDLDTKGLNFTTELTLFDLTAYWKYSSANQFATDWKTNAATSAAWIQVGNEVGKVVGYGEVDPLGSTTSPAVISDSGASYYFTKVWNLVSAPAAGKKLRLRMYIDDGVQLFINGVLAYEFSCINPISDASLTYFAVSSGTTETTDPGHVWAERLLHEILIDASFLQAGDNLFAAHLHQNGTASGDLSWAMSLEIGTSTDAVPAKTDPVPFTNGYGQPMKNKFPYVPSGCVSYRKIIDSNIEVFVINDGIRSDSRMTDPRWYTSDSSQAVWLNAALLSSTRPFKLVCCHRPFFSVNSGGSDRHNAALDWPFLKTIPGVVLCNGHNHQTLMHKHSSGLYIVNASNVGRQDDLGSMEGSFTGLTAIYEDATLSNSAVAVFQASATLLRCQLRKTSNGAVLASFTIPAP